MSTLEYADCNSKGGTAPWCSVQAWYGFWFGNALETRANFLYTKIPRVMVRTSTESSRRKKASRIIAFPHSVSGLKLSRDEISRVDFAGLFAKCATNRMQRRIQLVNRFFPNGWVYSTEDYFWVRFASLLFIRVEDFIVLNWFLLKVWSMHHATFQIIWWYFFS